MFNRIKSALIYLRFSTWVNQPQWSREDAMAFAAFLATPSGVKLSDYLRNYVLISQRNAVISQSNREFECGVSNGKALAIQQLSELSNPDQFPAEEGDSPAPSDD